MSEVAVTKKAPEGSALSRENDWFRPFLPSSRLWGLGPLAMFREMSADMDRFFQGIGSGTEIDSWAPTIDVQRSNGSLEIAAELPGLKKEEVKVEVTDKALVIHGERKKEHKEDHEGYHRFERSYGQFYRSIPLPDGAKADQVKAELKDGVLKVSIPVAEVEKKSRQVQVVG